MAVAVRERLGANRLGPAGAARWSRAARPNQPPGAAPAGPRPPAGHLPPVLSSFVGRQAELEMVVRLLAGDGVRLLTLTGPGGSGKTRLALRAAEAARADFPDGVWLVELAALADPALVPQAVAAALGVGEEAGRPLFATLAAALGDRRALLVLDNCEHLIDACAWLAEALLRACPDLGILATSRAPLGVTGEVVRCVPSLGVVPADHLPTVEAVGASEAAQLFVERAAAAQPAFALTPATAPLVAQLCRRLDGLPLALELAAARLRVLSLEQLVQRLDDRFHLLAGGSRTALPRQRTLRATLDWSHDLLGGPQRVLLRRLSVFAGSWTLAAAEAVGAGDGIAPGEVLDLLAALVDQSLVQVDTRASEGRYGLLETVRQYALERLREAGEEAAVRDRHLAWCLALVEQAEPRLTGPEQADWLARLEAEHDTLRAALAWAAESGAVERGSRLASGLWRFWFMRGRLGEGLQWLEAVIAHGDGIAAAARAKALTGAGWLARRRGEAARATTWYEASLALYRELDDKRAIAEALNDLAMTLAEQRDYARAAALHEESLALCRELDERRGSAVALTNLGRVMNDRGEYARAVALHEEALALFRELGDTANIAYVLENLPVSLTEQGDYARALALLDECLALRRALGDHVGVAMALLNMGRVACYQRDYARSTALLEESLALRRALGMTRRLANPLLRLAMTVRDQGDPARAVALLHESLPLFAEAGDRRGLALCLEETAQAAAGCGQPDRAARLLGAAAAIREAIGAPRERADRPAFDRTVAVLRAALGEADLAAAWAAGRGLSPEQAVAEARAVAVPAASPAAPPPPPARVLPAAPVASPAAAAPGGDPGALTPRELVVLRQIAAGRSSQEIAAELTLSARTVERHITNLYGKLGLRNRAEATIFALRHGLA
jgi:non-specific serine/threonine protein kinase